MIFTIAAKELKALFASPLAWVVLTAMQLVSGYNFLRRIDDFLQLQPRLAQMASPPGVTELVIAPVYATAAVIFLFVVPLLAMRAIAEERRNHTMVFLMSAPVAIGDIVLGKFLGLLGFLFVAIGLLALMPFALAGSTTLDYGLIVSLTLGLTLLAACFASVSLYVSCLTVHPVVAALGAFSALLGMLLAGETAGDSLRTRGWHVPAALMQVFTPIKNFEPLGRGIIDSYAIACSVLLVALFVVLTVRRLDAMRLRG
jgi:ABC-2 type transport system permease protein